MALSIQAQGLNVNAEVDRTNIEIGETITLTVTANKQNAEPINFNDLQIQFDILRHNRSSQMNIINGNIAAKTQWTLLLSPKDTGSLIIPSFNTEGAFSEPITIQVNKTTSNSSTSQHEEVFLEAFTDRDNVYVQQQIIYTVRLYYRISLSGYQESKLIVDNAAIEAIHESNYQKKIKGITYNVLEKRYAIYPQTSGKLRIPQQQWQLERPSRSFGFGSNSVPFRRVTSDAIRVTINPIATTSTADHWLPSSVVSLSQQWQQSIVTAKIGEPINYTLTITAEGLQSSQLPAIEMNSNEFFTIYKDQPEANNSKTPTGINSQLTSHYAIIPKKTGRHSLPPIRLKWWNINTDKEETIELHSQKITVAQTELSQQTLPQTIPQQTTVGSSESKTSRVDDNPFWKLLSGVLSILLITTIALLALQQYRHRQLLENKAIKEKNKQSKVDHALKKLYPAIKHSIDQHTWGKLRKQLLIWASLTSKTRITRIEKVAELFPELQEMLRALEQEIYSNSKTTEWNSQGLVETLKKQQIKTQKKQQGHLPPLYPETA